MRRPGAHCQVQQEEVRVEVTHSLGVPFAEVGPHKGTDNVSDLHQVSLTLKIPAKEIFQELKIH